jgi:hypothetical protein
MGYFQLMKAVDVFIYYDDVTYIKQGWINRNNIIVNGEPFRFTLELQGASSFKKINEIEIGKNREKLYKTFFQAYSKAPYFKDVCVLLQDMFYSKEENLFRYILETHQRIFNHLGIEINYLVSSEIDKDVSLKAQDKVLDICKRLGATKYINAIGGQHLYSREDFANKGVDLFFIQPSADLPKTSIIDVLMNNSPEEIKVMFENYDLI